MQSFYSDFLNANDVDSQQLFFFDEGEEGYDDSDEDKDEESETVVDFPVKRFFLECGETRVSIKDKIESTCIMVPVPVEHLAEYFDGYLVETHPVATRFTLSRQDYLKIRNEIEDNDLFIINFNHGFHTDYSNGVIVSSARSGDDMIVIAAFETEGESQDA